GDGFDPVRMRQPDDRDLGNAGVPEDGLFDFAAGDILAAGLDHVLLAVDHRDIAVRVDRGEVAAMEPAACEGRRASLLVVEVTLQQLRRAMDDLTDLARLDVAHLIVDHTRLHVQRGPAGGARLAELVFGLQYGCERRDFGLTVEIPQT